MQTTLSKKLLSCVFWTRTVVLVLAIAVVAASLSIYSVHTVPIFSLFGVGGAHQPMHNQSSTLLEMIRDRRLISTLVAAQASVFCPLFLLLNSSNSKKQQQHRNKGAIGASHDSLALDLICCHVLMPLGLALSWTFCIMFDRKTTLALEQSGYLARSSWVDYAWHDICLLDRDVHGTWPCIAVNAIHGLKYLIVLVLLMEIYLVIVAAVVMRRERQHAGAIQLCDEDKQHGETVSVSISFMDAQQREAFMQHQV